MYVNVVRYRGNIIDIHYDENGNKKINYYNENLNLQLGVQTTEKTEWKSLTGKYIQPHNFSTIYEYYNFIKEHEENLEIFGNIDPCYQFINQNYQNVKHNLNFIKTFILDIEVKSDKGFPDPETTPQPITSISIIDQKNNRYYACSTKPYNKFKNELNINPKRIRFYHAPNEKRLFMWFIKLMQKELPDSLVGWYSDNFDFPYIINRSYVVFDGEDKISDISPYGDVRSEVNDNGPYGQRAFRNTIGGVYLLDYIKLYKKFLPHKPRESYSLEFISNVELGESKLKFDESNLNELWENNPQKYIDYNIYDVELINLIDKKLKLIDLLATLAYKAKCNFIDGLGTVKIWDVLIYNDLLKKNIMIPPNVPKEKEKYVGGYVKEPICDIHNWVLSLDLNSLYPHLQQQFNISPESLVKSKREIVNMDKIDDDLLNEKIKVNPKYILAGNGCYFRKDKEGFIPKILKEIYSERKNIKDEMMIKKKKLENLKNKLRKMEEKK